MRTLKPLSTRATVIRTQERMDQRYFIEVTRNIMGELQITQEDFETHSDVRSFSGYVFPTVLHRISEMNSSTLGSIAAYGLGKGQTSKDIPLRATTLKDVWYGTPLDLDLSGGVCLEWLAATTVVAAIFDILRIHAFVGYLHEKAEAGGENGVPVAGLLSGMRH
jgi:hypothetical protein